MTRMSTTDHALLEQLIELLTIFSGMGQRVWGHELTVVTFAWESYKANLFYFPQNSVQDSIWCQSTKARFGFTGTLSETLRQFSQSVVSDSLQPYESQHARPPCPSPSPGVHSDSCPSSQWRHPAISSSVVPFSSCPQSLPASESFPMSQLFTWGGSVLEFQL